MALKSANFALTVMLSLCCCCCDCEFKESPSSRKSTSHLSKRMSRSSSSSSARFVANPFADYDGQECLSTTSPSSSGQLRDDIAKRITDAAFGTAGTSTSTVNSLFSYWEQHFVRDLDDFHDLSVYTGATGGILLYLKLAEAAESGGTSLPGTSTESCLQKAASLVESALSRMRRGGRQRGRIQVPTFLCGEVGLLAAAAVLEAKLHCQEGTSTSSLEELLSEIARQAASVADLDATNRRGTSSLPDELLYGRAGYLYTLLWLRKEAASISEVAGTKTSQILSDQLIRSVVKSILDSGVRTSSQNPHLNSPLVYFWHDSPYVGAAHGYAGIAYLLLQARAYLTQDELTTLVKPTIDFICSLRFPVTDNFPSSIGEDKTDKLVHWCHGSPGVIYLLATASSVFEGGDAEGNQYAQIALKAGEDIWARGLLKKGYGLCHGAAGNAYAFLRLYQLTGGRDGRWLHRAVKFADWCSAQYGRHAELGVRTAADRPFSLFEGLAGTLYFLVDILHPLEARFPAFQLD